MLVLTNTESYTGLTRVSAGSLELGNGTANGALSTSSSIADNGTLVFNNSGTTTQGTQFSGAAINGTGGLIQASTGTLVLNAANGFSGTTTISAGALELAGSNTLANSILSDNLAATNALTFATSGLTYTIGGLSGSGNLALAATGGSNPITLSVGGNTTPTTYSGVLAARGLLRSLAGA